MEFRAQKKQSKTKDQNKVKETPMKEKNSSDPKKNNAIYSLKKNMIL